jgi:hypothetical protein
VALLLKKSILNNLILKSVFLTIGLLAIFAVFLPQKTVAANGNNFYAGRIIDDSVFTNSTTMSVADIQNFLNSKVTNCVAGYTCLKNYSENGKGSAQIIWEHAQAYQINPQVILVTLQKEQGLITDTYPYSQYRTAMGMGCPDSTPGVCDAQYYGFTNQINYGTKHLRKFYNNDPNWFVPYAPGQATISWSPNGGCGTSTFTIENSATAALYSYTPYRPNQAALNNLYGTGDGCSAYGNRNFWREYTDWFGSTLGVSFTIIKSTTGLEQYVYESGTKRLIPSPQIKIAWNLQNQQIIEYSQAQIDAIPFRDNKPLSNITRIDGSQAVYLIDGGKKYYIPSTTTLQAWQFNVNNIADVGVGLGSKPYYTGVLGYSVRSYDANDLRIFMVDGGTLRPYNSVDILRSWEGDNPLSITPSQDLFNTLGSVPGSIDSNKLNNNGQEYLAVAQQRLTSNPTISSLYPGTSTTVSNATIARLIPSAPASWFVRANNDQTVYLIDGGTKHAVQSPDHLTAWSPGGVQKVNIVTGSVVNSIPTGAPLTQFVANQSGQYFFFTGQKLPIPTNLANDYANSLLGSFNATPNLLSLYINGPQASGFLRGATTPTVFLLDGSKKRSVTDWNTFVLWNGTRNESTTLVYDFSLSQFGQDTNVNSIISSLGNSYALDNGVYYQVDPETSSNWGFTNYTQISSSTLARFSNGGILTSSAKVNNIYYLIRNSAKFATTINSIADVWGISTAQPHSSTFLTKVNNGGLLQPFFAVNNPADLRIFLKDSDKSYVLTSPQQVYNFGFINSLLPKLGNTELSNISTSQSAKNNINYLSNYYIIDNGKKRLPNDNSTQAAWNLTTPNNYISVTSALANYLIDGSNSTILIKGSAPNVYAVENGTKRWITGPQILSQNFPGIQITLVSDNLLQLLPSGPAY